MNSIDRQQPEKNHEDLNGPDSVAKVRDLVNRSEICFFATAAPVEGSSGARPMSAQQVDDDGNLWFLSAEDSHMNQEIARDAAVKLYFQVSAHSGFLFLNGTVTISRDKEKIRELWEPLVKNWFTEGVDDPRITVLRFTPIDGYYWDTKHGRTVAGIKMLIGAAIGRTLDDSIQGRLAF